ncbi:hypothetical protein ABFA07_004408 [Porites harrisoni]
MSRLYSIIAALLVMYVLEKVTATKQESTVYIHQEDQDNQPPSIRCPYDFTKSAEPGKATRRVEWRQPLATDNQDRFPTVLSFPKNIVSPHQFPIGVTRIVYTATDDSGNSQSCVFTVTIIDTEPPRITCPKNIKVIKNTAGPVVSVHWPMPHYEDNSEKPVTLFTESVQGSGFRVGQHFIKYEARDQAGNTAFCTFTITVSGLGCPSYPPPFNGLIACAPLASLDGTVCTPQCNDNKDFRRIPANLYICQPETGRWNVWDFRPTVSRMLPWPDCTGDDNSDFPRKGERWQSLKGSCAGDPTTQRQAKMNLIRGIEATFGGSMGLLEKDVNIMCGKTGDKRSVTGR